MRILRLPILGMVIVLALTAIFMVIYNVHATPAMLQVKIYRNPYPPGFPAIQPHLKSTSLNTPTFTIDDVKQYVLMHGFPGGVPVKGAHLVITSIQFMTAKTAADKYVKAGVNRPGNALICLVQLKGPFLLTGAHIPPAFYEKYGIPIERTGMIVFDAQTGYMLSWTGVD